MDTVNLGSLTISRFILGSNPFSGFSHQGELRDKEMKHYYNTTKIKEILHNAENLGITTFIGRADEHVIRMLMEYWDEGGKLKWVAQTCPGVGPTEKVAHMAVQGGASAMYIHGGVMDHALAHHSMGDPKKGIKIARDAGIPIGIAGHNPAVFPWAVKHLDVDFYMCCYYNSAHRDKSPEKFPNQKEWFVEDDRAKMAATIQTLKKPVIHYKVLAAGRNDPKSAFEFAAKTMRSSDAICVGIFAKDNVNMLRDDISLFEKAWKQAHPF